MEPRIGCTTFYGEVLDRRVHGRAVEGADPGRLEAARGPDGTAFAQGVSAMSSDLILWGVGTSRTMRAHWMLLELGVEYRFHAIGPRTGETRSGEFLRLNPRHKIPVLQHGSLVLTESAAIIEYLSETFPNPQIYRPPSRESFAALSEWCYFIMSELDAASLYMVRRHLGLKDIYGEAPVAVQAAKTYFSHNLEAMAPRIGIASPYLFGSKLSTADILLMTCLEWARAEQVMLPESVMKYRERVAGRSAYQAALARNFAQ
jgi:glutathione S-transferase